MQFRIRGRGARLWVPVIFIGIGSVFLVIGLVLAGLTASFLADAERASGTVVSLHWVADDDRPSSRKRASDNDDPVAYPVVRFTPAGSGPRTFRGSTGSNPPGYEVGEAVDVLYRPDAPDDARIDGFASLWLLPLIFTGLGVLLAGIGATILAVTRRRAVR